MANSGPGIPAMKRSFEHLRGGKSAIVTATMNLKLKKLLDAEAARRGVSIAHLIRRAFENEIAASRQKDTDQSS
jgi:hypothetical protein